MSVNAAVGVRDSSPCLSGHDKTKGEGWCDTLPCLPTCECTYRHSQRHCPKVNPQPIPLDLLTLANFTDPPTQRSGGILRLGGLNTRGGGNTETPTPGANGTPESAVDSRMVYPRTIHHNGRLGGLYTVFAESAQARAEWKQKLEEAIGLRKVVQESNKVFEVETLSADTFFVPAVVPGGGSAAYSHENAFTGKVTCSVPFSTSCD